MKSMKKAVMAVVAAMMVVGAGSAAWACGPYGALSPEQEEQQFVNIMEMQLGYQQKQLQQARNEGDYLKMQKAYTQILEIQAQIRKSEATLAKLRQMNQELASVK